MKLPVEEMKVSQDRPAAVELLRTVREFVDSVRPKLAGEDQYHAVVAAYLLGILERELTLGSEFDRQEEFELARFPRARIPPATGDGRRRRGPPVGGRAASTRSRRASPRSRGRS